MTLYLNGFLGNGMSLTGDKKIIQLLEEMSLSAIVVDEDLNPKVGETVEFLQFNPLLFYFEGRGGFEVDSCIVQPHATLTSDDTGTTFSASGGTGFVWANVYGTDEYLAHGDYMGDTVVDLDVISTSGNGRVSFYEAYPSNVQQAFTLRTGHNKIVKIGNSFEHFVDGVSQGTVSKSLVEPYRIGLITDNGTNLKFNNFNIGGF